MTEKNLTTKLSDEEIIKIVRNVKNWKRTTEVFFDSIISIYSGRFEGILIEFGYEPIIKNSLEQITELDKYEIVLTLKKNRIGYLEESSKMKSSPESSKQDETLKNLYKEVQEKFEAKKRKNL